jgi:glycosyltransferase involved in cell wall biosynthesis
MQKRILFIGHDANYAGAQYLLLHLLTYLKESKGIETLLLLGSGGGLENEFKKVTEVIHWQNDDENSNGNGYFQKIAKVSRLEPFLTGGKNVKNPVLKRIESFNPDILFSNTIANGALLQKLEYLNCPFLIYCHELEKSIHTYSTPEDLNFQLTKAAFILVGSKAVRDNLINKHNVITEKIGIYTSYIDCKSMKAEYDAVDKNTVKSALSISPEAIIVGGCGLLEWRKGVDIFINTALQVIKSTAKDVHFIWVGVTKKSTEYYHLKFDLERMGITEKVHLIESSTDIINYTACFDLFFMSSREDPYPLVMIEASLNKIPLICFDKSGGAVDFVDSEVDMIIPYLDIQKAAEKLVEIIENKQDRVRLGEIFYEKAWSHDISVICPKILEKVLEFVPQNINTLAYS